MLAASVTMPCKCKTQKSSTFVKLYHARWPCCPILLCLAYLCYLNSKEDMLCLLYHHLNVHDFQPFECQVGNKVVFPPRHERLLPNELASKHDSASSLAEKTEQKLWCQWCSSAMDLYFLFFEHSSSRVTRSRVITQYTTLLWVRNTFFYHWKSDSKSTWSLASMGLTNKKGNHVCLNSHIALLGTCAGIRTNYCQKWSDKELINFQSLKKVAVAWRPYLLSLGSLVQ